MSREEFNKIMADSHDQYVDNRIETAYDIISKQAQTIKELRDVIYEYWRCVETDDEMNAYYEMIKHVNHYH